MTGSEPSRSGRVLAVDLGSKRIGLALSDPSRTIASPLTMIERSRSSAADHDAIAAVVAEHDVALVVVGLPKSLSGAEGPAARAARTEIAAIAERLGERCPVVAHDERLTTVSAHRALRDGNVKGRDRRDKVDKVAAAVLLQHFLEGNVR